MVAGSSLGRLRRRLRRKPLLHSTEGRPVRVDAACVARAPIFAGGPTFPSYNGFAAISTYCDLNIFTRLLESPAVAPILSVSSVVVGHMFCIVAAMFPVSSRICCYFLLLPVFPSKPSENVEITVNWNCSKPLARFLTTPFLTKWPRRFRKKSAQLHPRNKRGVGSV